MIRITLNELREIVKESLVNIMEINHLAEKSNITVCGLNDFKNIVRSLGITDSNVGKYVGKYCFIEVGSSYDRITQEIPLIPDEYDENGNVYNSDRFYSEGQYYFKSEHNNVLKLEFDDNQKFNNKKGNQYTAVKLSPEETRTNKSTTFYFKDGKDFTMEMANNLKTFVDKNLKYNPNVKFIIHCKQGRSRSAAIGTYIAKKIGQLSSTFLGEYDGEDRNQFNMGISRKGQPKYPHKNVMNRMGDIEGWNKEKDDTKNQWYYDVITNHPKFGYNAQKPRQTT